MGGSFARCGEEGPVASEYDEDGYPVGAAEIMLDYAPTAVIVSSATRTVTLLVLGGFALLWVLLFAPSDSWWAGSGGSSAAAARRPARAVTSP